MNQAFLVPLVVLCGTPLALLASLVLWLTADLDAARRDPSRSWYQAAWNVANVALQLSLVWALWAAFAGALDDHLALVFAGAAAATLCSLAVVALGNLTGGESLRWLRTRGFAHEAAVQFVLLPALGVIAAILYGRHPLAALLALAPVLAIRMAISEGEGRRSAESRLGLDPLTGLPDHRRFWEQLEDALETHECLAVVFLDVDGFKALNDGHGHLAGDECLVAVAASLTGSLRRGDVACRYGGEEFALILPGAGRAEAVAVAERARAALPASHRLRPTASFGVAAYPSDATSARAIVRVADAAVYRAKGAGRDRVVTAAPAAEAA
jgi:diguanylate cyclase (GGDEF)-like protein